MPASLQGKVAKLRILHSRPAEIAVSVKLIRSIGGDHSRGFLLWRAEERQHKQKLGAVCLKDPVDGR
jgi:hypothetical protein